MNRLSIYVVLVAMGLSACVQDSRMVKAPEDKKKLEEVAVAQIDTAVAASAANQPVAQEMHSELLASNSAGMASPNPAMKRSYRSLADSRQFYHVPNYPTDRENYLDFQDNRLQQVINQPVSTFSVDVDTAAYSNVRRMLLREGRLPPQDAVKVEEFINYFEYAYARPDSNEVPFSINTEIAPSPWNSGSYLLQVGLRGYEPELSERKPANLVFLVDVSGSMRSQHKLALVKKSLRLLVNQLDEGDRVALVVYAGAAGAVLESTPGNQKAKIMAAIDQLEAGGSTNGGAGIQLAYNIAEQYRIPEGINRVLIASDGDMNVGMTSLDDLKQLIETKRKRGIALTTLGYGTGNYNYALMEQLADVGNGNAAYIDNLREAQKVLVRQMGSTLQTIAKDVKIQIEFNPATVAEYRLIGYENRLLQREDFRNDKVDAGDIGMGHTVTALYEITLAGSDSRMIDPLRYQEERGARPVQNDLTDELAFVRLRFKQPGGEKSSEVSRALLRSEIVPSLQQSSADFRFAAAVAGFGQLLRGGQHTGDWGYRELLELARSARGPDEQGYRAEMLALVELSQNLAGTPGA